MSPVLQPSFYGLTMTEKVVSRDRKARDFHPGFTGLETESSPGRLSVVSGPSSHGQPGNFTRVHREQTPRSPAKRTLVTYGILVSRTTDFTIWDNRRDKAPRRHGARMFEQA